MTNTPRQLRLFQVDAFTSRPFTGNPAAVVLGADELTESEMRAIAREMNKGDTAFVLAPASAAEDLRVLFFSPRKAMPFVGHATLATHAVLSRLDPMPLRRQGGLTGVVEVRTLHDNAGFSIRQEAPALARTPGESEIDAVLQHLGLSRQQLDPRCPPRIAGTASTRLLLGLRDVAALDQMQPDLRALAQLTPRIGAHGYFAFTLLDDQAALRTESRMFCPALGIDEDAVSGNAHAMLGVHLLQLGVLRAEVGRAHFTGAQGRHVERGGQVAVEIETGADGRAVAASIAGQAVIVFEGMLTL